LYMYRPGLNGMLQNHSESYVVHGHGAHRLKAAVLS